MKEQKCNICGNKLVKNGKTSSGKTRWRCLKCGSSVVVKYDKTKSDFKRFLNWLLSKKRMVDMPGQGRSFRRATNKFWNIWPLAPIVDEIHDVIYVDGLHLGRSAVILIACTDKYVLSWHVARSEKIASWKALLSRIAPPQMVVTDGGTGFQSACKEIWPNTEIQRCTFHVYNQVKRYTTMNPKLLAGKELLLIARQLLHVKTIADRNKWIDSYVAWTIKWSDFLEERTLFEDGHRGYTHERLRSAQSSLNAVIRSDTLFTYLKPYLNIKHPMPSKNNRIEGDINARLRDMLREHKGMSLIRRIKACFWVCYMHTEKPMSIEDILKYMPSDESIAEAYNSLYYHERNFSSIPQWGDAIVWGEFHKNDEWRHDWD